ncbi:hypothetical protein SAMN05660816_04695 [Niastella yeongjuensis]|nr:hypothetical protein SAMN05660816_04695 [Niastella yeongjuensis]
MYILFEAIAEKIREFITSENKRHRSMYAGALLYSCRAATHSCPLQLNNDSFLKY